jgi:hypothetical protein
LRKIEYNIDKLERERNEHERSVRDLEEIIERINYNRWEAIESQYDYEEAIREDKELIRDVQ